MTEENTKTYDFYLVGRTERATSHSVSSCRWIMIVPRPLNNVCICTDIWKKYQTVCGRSAIKESVFSPWNPTTRPTRVLFQVQSRFFWAPQALSVGSFRPNLLALWFYWIQSTCWYFIKRTSLSSWRNREKKKRLWQNRQWRVASLFWELFACWASWAFSFNTPMLNAHLPLLHQLIVRFPGCSNLFRRFRLHRPFSSFVFAAKPIRRCLTFPSLLFSSFLATCILCPRSYDIRLAPGGANLTLPLRLSPGGGSGSSNSTQGLIRIDVMLVYDTNGGSRNEISLLSAEMDNFVSFFPVAPHCVYREKQLRRSGLFSAFSGMILLPTHPIPFFLNTKIWYCPLHFRSQNTVRILLCSSWIHGRACWFCHMHHHKQHQLHLYYP